MSAPGNGCNVQRFKLLIYLTMESHIKVTDLLSVKIKKTLKSFQNKVLIFPATINLSVKEHTIYVLYVSLFQSPINSMRLEEIPD